MILINKAIGSVRIPDMQFTLQHKQIVKVSDYVENSLIQKSLMSPHGNLYIAAKEGIIRVVQEFDKDYKYFEDRIHAYAHFIDPETKLVNTREGLLKFFATKTDQEKINFVESLGYAYYDFFIELRNKLIAPEYNYIKDVITKKIDSFKDNRIAENFVLLDLT
jgi:hypothetical protein